MENQPAPRDARRAKRRPGKAMLILAVMAGCAAALVGLVVLVSTTESPVDGPSAPVLAVALVAAPVVAAVILIARILAGGAGRDDDLLP
jgi:peptidoglycan/LPS O-acetylase OafA/YrhL